MPPASTQMTRPRALQNDVVRQPIETVLPGLVAAVTG
jgi:hypothetical protein